MNIDQLIQMTLMLFIVVDPLGNAPLFYWLTSDMEKARRRRIIKMSVLVATGMLVFFSLVGDLFFYYFGMTLSDFKIAGGIILFIYGLEGVLGRTEVAYIERGQPESIAVVPMATPLLAGPGAIATVIYIKMSLGLAAALIAVGVNSLVALLLLLRGADLLDLLGRNGAIVLTRIIAMMLLGFSVAIIREGIVETLASIRQS